jgi:Flp pilus assembly protein TadG
MSFLRPARRGEEGQAQVEFALVIVFLMLLIVGFIEVIMMMHTYNVLADAAKEGVRYAIVHGAANTLGCGPASCAAITGSTGVVKTYAQTSFHDTTKMTVTVNYNPDVTLTNPNGDNGANCNKSPCLVQVTVNYPYQPIFGLGWPTVNVNAAAEGRIIF